jgi:hypothetical protein
VVVRRLETRRLASSGPTISDSRLMASGSSGLSNQKSISLWSAGDRSFASFLARFFRSSPKSSGPSRLICNHRMVLPPTVMAFLLNQFGTNYLQCSFSKRPISCATIILHCPDRAMDSSRNRQKELCVDTLPGIESCRKPLAKFVSQTVTIMHSNSFARMAKQE